MKKIRVLAWGDAPTANTGFGTVSKYVLSAIQSTDQFEINQLGINYHGDFVDKNEVPWQLVPSKLLDPKDPHGIKMFHRAIMKDDYDIIWVLNDLFVSHEAATAVDECRTRYRSQGKKPPVFIHYFPVDCQVSKHGIGFLERTDIPVAYTDHGKAETLKTIPSISNKLRQIPHGVDTNIFFPFPRELRNKFRKDLLQIEPDTTLVINVNRNSTRKQIPYTILAFKEFKKKVPNSILYLHMQELDQGGSIARMTEDAGLEFKKDVIWPKNFNLANGLPPQTVNKIYNCGDIFLTTHLGEGWGLTITEAMACGVPVVCPNNTCMPQQLGENSERGYLYPCNDTIYIDTSGYRQKGLLPDIVDQMMNAYNDGPKENNPKVKLALEFAREHDWKFIGTKWIELFKIAANAKTKAFVNLAEVV